MQAKIKKLEHDAMESAVRTEARGVEREELENKLAEAEVRLARCRLGLFYLGVPDRLHTPIRSNVYWYVLTFFDILLSGFGWYTSGLSRPPT